MPITFEVDAARQTIFTRAAGRVSKADFFAYQEALAALPDPGSFNECFDLSAVTEFAEATDKNMINLARLSVQSDDPERPTRLAIIAESDLQFGLARMYETYRSMQPGHGRRVGIFRTREEALRWLEK